MGKVLGGIGLGIVTLLVVVFAAVLILPGLIDWSRYKSEIAAQVENNTGRKLTIDGDLSLKVLPQPAMEVTGVSLSGLEGEETQFVVAERIAANLALAPLFSGDVKVRSIVIANAQVNLNRNADGKANWNFKSKDDTRTPGVGLDTRADNQAVGDFSVDSLILENVSVNIADAVSEVQSSLVVDEMEIGAVSLNGPFRMKGTVRLDETVFTVQAGIGSFNALSEAANLTAEVGVNDGLRLAFDGNFRNFESGVRVNGKTRLVSGNAQVAVNDLLHMAESAKLDGIPADLALAPLAQTLELEFAVAANQNEVRIRDLDGKLGSQLFQGALTALFLDKPEISAQLKVTSFNLDPWIRSSETRKTASSGEGAQERSSITLPELTLPKDLTVALELTFETTRFSERIIPSVDLDAELRDGRLNIAKLDGLLPAGAKLQVKGLVQTPDNRPKADLSIMADIPNMRGLAGLLGLDFSNVPADRLLSAQLDGALALDSKRLSFATQKLAVDDVRAKVGVVQPFDGNPVSLSFEADRLNLNPYLALAQQKVADPNPLTAPSPKQPKNSLVDLPNVNLAVALGTLYYDNLIVSGLDLASRLRGDTISLDRLVIADLSGSQLKATGTLDLSTAPMTVVLDAEITAKDLAKLGAQAGSRDLSVLSHLSPFSGDLAVRSQGKGGTISITGKAAGSSIRISGSSPDALMEPLTASGAIELSVSAPSLSKLAALGMGPNDLPAMGPTNLVFKAKGNLAGVDTDLRLENASVILAAKGKAKNLLIDPYADLKLDIRAADTARILADFGSDAGNLNTGVPLSVTGDFTVTGENAKTDNLRMTIGDALLNAKVDSRFGKERPKLAIEAGWDTLDLTTLTEKKSPKSKPKSNSKATAAAEQKKRWSNEPLPLSGLRDLELALSAKGKILRVANLALREPTVKLDMDGGRGSFELAAKNVYDGELTGAGSWTIAEGRDPSLEMTIGLDLSKSDLEQATELLAEPGKPSPLTGTLGLASTIDLKGRTQAQLISSLGGSVRISARNGVIRGIDLKKLSGQLDYLDDTAAFIKLASIAMNEGETAYRMLETVQLGEEGVFNTAQFAADVDAAEIILFNRIDLPTWRLDLDSRMKFRDHPKAPDVGVRLAGVLDNPERTVDTQALQQFLVARFLERGIGRVLGIKKQQTAPVAEPVVEPSVNPFEEGPAPTVPKEKPDATGTGPTGSGPASAGATGTITPSGNKELSPEDVILDTLLNNLIRKK